ncbi:3-deoxy-D-manno-octulosonic acid transferase [bacterium]|nr:3-deoxy-D-manno-octulosonic acid transferase [bacterium]
MTVLYTFLYIAGLLASSPYWLWRAWKKNELHLIPYRLGFQPLPLAPAIRNPQSAIRNPILWVHAVSVGEVRAAKPFLEAMRSARPDFRIVLSVTTRTGMDVARRVLAEVGSVEGPVMFPLDLPWAVSRRLDEITPAAIVFMETEIWPNLIAQAARRNVNLFLVNGRISDRSFPRYRLARFYLKRLLTAFSHCWMQSDENADRLKALGATAGRVSAAGNLKIDAMLEDIRKRAGQDAAPDENAVPVFLAASTHPGEEEIVLNAARRWKSAGRRCILHVAPRHPERGNDVARLIESRGWNPVRRTSGAVSGENDVLLIDTIGELPEFFSKARVVFVGGSLVPRGGHNIYEPAAAGRPVVFGPYMENFREAAAQLSGRGGIQVKSAAEFDDAIAALLFDPVRAREEGRKARAAVESLTGSAGRIARELAGMLSA